jgi:hypothetical protein
MARVGTVLLLALVVGAATISDAAAARKKPLYGLFGTVNGKKFSAVNIGSADDGCVTGIYKPADAILTMAALECTGPRRRRVVKKNYKAIVLACARFDPATSLIPPFEIPCIASAYEEWVTGRFRIPKSSRTWTSSLQLPAGTFYPTSALNLRIESFDGTYLQASVSGIFDTPQPGATGRVTISGQMTLNIPIRVQ